LRHAVGPADIHRVAHVAGEPAVTINAYSPQLRRMGAYVESTDGVLLRHALDEDVELRADLTGPTVSLTAGGTA
jgi:hypothetical protein